MLTLCCNVAPPDRLSSILAGQGQADHLLDHLFFACAVFLCPTILQSLTAVVDTRRGSTTAARWGWVGVVIIVGQSRPGRVISFNGLTVPLKTSARRN